jgi:membrane protease subunit (stomatin/prohibitin family)
MGLFDFIKSQFIEVIEATDLSPDMIVFRFPVEGQEIKMGAQLTVREAQCAIFINEGVMADVFMPGRYTLSTENMPVLTKLKSWKYGFNSPFKAEVYFISTRLFTNQKWGTANPVLLRDAEFGMIRLSAYGVFAFRVVKPDVFLREIFGSLPSFSASDIQDYLRRMVVSNISDLFGELKIPAIDIAASYNEIGAEARLRVQKSFEAIGLELQNLVVENVSLPEEVEKVIDKRTSMGVLGDMGKYTQYQAAEAIRDFAQNEGGGNIAGMGVGIGAGVQVGQAFAGAMSESLRANAPTPAAAPADEKAPADAKCVSCGAKIDAGAKFCPECGKPQIVRCPSCGTEIKGKFCPECGQPRP